MDRTSLRANKNRATSLSISRCLSQMENDGLSVDDLFNQCVFRKDERDMVLKAVHIVQPDYQPRRNATASQCSSPLVQDFYKQVSLASFDLYDMG